jgi:DNA-binding transcriptional regulator LsrR (DeoR family)
MGIGPVKLSRQIPLHWLNDILKRKGLDVEKYRERLHERGAVGDILYHLVDKNGEPIDSEISNYVCSIGLKDLRRMVQQGGQDGVRVVVIASGREKREIIQAAIKGGYLNVLIIDDELARALLGFEQMPQEPAEGGDQGDFFDTDQDEDIF